MQLSPIRNKYITFSCRTAGERLAKNFPELDIPRNYVFINDRQYVKRMYDPTRDRFLDKYRDNRTN